MKNLLRLILPVAALAATSCNQYEYKQNLENYKDNIFYVEDQYTGDFHVSTHGTIEVEGDLATQSYSVLLKNVQLTAGSPLLSCDVTNLLQFFKEKGESEEEKYIPLYYFFSQEKSSARTNGDLDVANLRYCYITGSYWLSFKSESRYNVWATPRVRNLYANVNTVLSPQSAGYRTENTLHPAYRFDVDVEAKTVTIKGQGVKFPQDNQDVNKTLSFKTFELQNIPIEFSPMGYAFSVSELTPIIDGEAAPQHVITNLVGQIAFDYEGTKTLDYKMRNQFDENIFIHTEFGLYR